MLKQPDDFKRHFEVRGQQYIAFAYDTGMWWEYYASRLGSGEQYGPARSYIELVEEIRRRG